MQVSRGFEQNATRRHDGVDIVAPRGTSIQAAADGEVIFSGWGPGGYGRIVILQHQAEVVTIYAHNHDNLVRLGQRVRQGEPIATVGQSGRATGNHLHFEVRHKAVPIPPYKFLHSFLGLVMLLHWIAAKVKNDSMSPTSARIAYMIEALAAKIRDIKDFPKKGLCLRTLLRFWAIRRLLTWPLICWQIGISDVI